MRIRSIKPEFWRSEDIAVLDWETRLLFVGLWSYVDDNGVGIDRKADIAADLFAQDLEDDAPETFARVSRGLQTLSEAGLITRYSVAGKRFLHITSWDKHQRIDKPNKPRYPLPTCDDAQIRETVATLSRDSRETPAPGTGEQGNRGTDISCASADAEREFDEWYEHYPRKRGRGQALKAYRVARKKTSQQALIDAIQEQSPALMSKGPEFCPYPATWLNGERWADEPPRPPQPNGYPEGFPVNGTQAEKDAWAKSRPLPTDGAYYGGSRR
ncbi:MAG TPA: hypothetical protein VFH56_11075 [Acidimicrobiales bacterium]|nr:hypothetical protein [Acidimicrobiales bacterium]